MQFGSERGAVDRGTTTYALIGAPGDNKGAGAAWVFTRVGHDVDPAGRKVIAKSGEETGAGAFGFSVALSVGRQHGADRRARDNAEQTGAAWVFTRSGTTWTQQGAKLVAKAAKRPARASSASAWRSRAKKATPR